MLKFANLARLISAPLAYARLAEWLTESLDTSLAQKLGRSFPIAGLSHERIHDLCHSAISWWIYRGAIIKQVTARAGIASVATAFDRYGHIFPNEDRDLAQRLGQPVIPLI